MAHRPSKIDRLPTEIRDLIKELRENGRTIDEILAKLHELDVDVSRTGLGYHIQGIDAVLANVHETRAAAEVLAKRRLEDKADDRLAEANVEAMHAILMRLQMAQLMAKDGKIEMDARESMFLATALHKTISAGKLSTEEKIKIREQVEKETARKAAARAEKAVAEVGAKHGFKLPREALRAIREQVYGIVETP